MIIERKRLLDSIQKVLPGIDSKGVMKKGLIIRKGFCLCGCGQRTTNSSTTNKRLGLIKGQPNKFLTGHHVKGKNNPRWNNGVKRSGGYLHIRIDNTDKYFREHTVIVEKAMQKRLPPNAEIHHVDLDSTNNSPTNLVVCENHAYHMLLHQRTKALKACGNPNWRKCHFCKKYDDPKNLKFYNNKRNSKTIHHQACFNLDQNRRNHLYGRYGRRKN